MLEQKYMDLVMLVVLSVFRSLTQSNHIPVLDMCFLERRLKYFMSKRRCGMIANETTLHKRSNDTEVNNYRAQYGHQQLAKPIPYSQL